MGESYENLTIQFGTIYSEMLQMSEYHYLEILGTMGIKGSFLHKEIKGRGYWYLKILDSGQKPSYLYLGPDSQDLRNAMESVSEGKKSWKTLCSMALSGGAFRFDRSSGPVIEAMADSGLFHAGAVLVGTNAFLVYQNSLGIRWKSQGSSLQTQDADFAQFSRFRFGVPLSIEKNMTEALERLRANPVWSILHPKDRPVRFVLPGKYSIDFLSPMIGKESDRPVSLPWLGIHPQPLRFMDYLIEKPVKSLAFYGTKAFPVNIPSPGRFALHKLIVSERRERSFQDKISKDRRQASSLIEWLSENAPEEIHEAWDELLRRGRGWRNPALSGFSKLPDRIVNLPGVDLLRKSLKNDQFYQKTP
jgi:hypothetical protein